MCKLRPCFRHWESSCTNNAFRSTGNELTPGVKYDFKFKDYAPWVFRYLREKFHIDAADYMVITSPLRQMTLCVQNLLIYVDRCL